MVPNGFYWYLYGSIGTYMILLVPIKFVPNGFYWYLMDSICT